MARAEATEKRILMVCCFAFDVELDKGLDEAWNSLGKIRLQGSSKNEDLAQPIERK
jgi:hypothetical protein